MNLKEFYIKEYKKLLLLPVIIFILSFIIIGLQINKTGDIVDKDISLKGGISATVYTDKKINGLNEFLANKFNTDFIIRDLREFGSDKQLGIVIETNDINVNEFKKALEDKLNLKLTEENFSLEQTGSSLGESFYKQMLIAILFAFLLMAIAVLISFKKLIPGIAVVLSAFFDIIGTIAVIDLIGLKVSTAGIAAILLLIGYSVDTDILLTTRVLKRKEGNLNEKIFGSIKTGLTMTLTTLAALTTAYLISNSLVLKQMFLIIIIGLLFDIIGTYILNVSLLRIYLKKKNIE